MLSPFVNKKTSFMLLLAYFSKIEFRCGYTGKGGAFFINQVV